MRLLWQVGIGVCNLIGLLGVCAALHLGQHDGKRDALIEIGLETKKTTGKDFGEALCLRLDMNVMYNSEIF